jgi:hypothetical protein
MHPRKHQNTGPVFRYDIFVPQLLGEALTEFVKHRKKAETVLPLPKFLYDSGEDPLSNNHLRDIIG